MFEHVWRLSIINPIIAIFDFDEEGFTQLKCLLKNKYYIKANLPIYAHIYVHSNHKNIFIMLLKAVSGALFFCVKN